MSTVHKSDELRVFQKQCVSLAEHGVDVTFVAPSEHDYTDRNVKIIAIKAHSSKLSRLLVQPFRVAKAAIKLKADFYQFHDFELWPIAMLFTLMGRKVVADVHEDVPGQILHRTWIPSIFRKAISRACLWGENFFSRWMAAIITADDALADRFSLYNRNVCSIKNYPLELGLPPENLKDNQVVITSLGGVYDERCADLIINVAKDNPGIKFEIGGGISNKYKSLDWQTDNCRYIGYLEQDQLLKKYSDSYALIVMFSNAPNHQSIKSNRFFESMYSGKPVIVSKLPQWEEFIDKYRCGLSVDLECGDDFSRVVRLLQSDHSLAKELGRNGKKAVDNEFSWKSQVTKLIEFYNSLPK